MLSMSHATFCVCVYGCHECASVSDVFIGVMHVCGGGLLCSVYVCAHNIVCVGLKMSHCKNILTFRM